MPLRSAPLRAVADIVTGSAGCQEMHEPFTRAQPARSAFRSNTFGYSKFIVHNASHANWQQPRAGQRFFVGPFCNLIEEKNLSSTQHGEGGGVVLPSPCAVQCSGGDCLLGFAHS